MPEAPAVSGLDRERLKTEGAEPAVALGEFSAWVRDVSTGAQPVMCGYPASYDQVGPQRHDATAFAVTEAAHPPPALGFARAAEPPSPSTTP